MTPDEIRASYLKYFEDLEHEVVDSSPVVPQGDPTLLFTNAGMNQFKDVLLGNEVRDYTRATSSQKCIRAGGKHNDLDEVGRDGRHLTFFEMLGNWSFGDYYKSKAINWAWDYVLNTLDLDRDRLYVTIYKDDDDSFDIWTEEQDVPAERVLRLGNIEEGNEENFWSMGPTGPCGPCTEIHYDLKPELGDFAFEAGYDEERIVEIWNLVFMEFNRDETGALDPLPMKSVDTGLGLDRVAMIKAGAENIFQTELFLPVFRHVASLLSGDEVDDNSVMIDGEEIPIEDLLHVDSQYFPNLAVIGDHIRALMFAVCDGAKFSNEGRGYVLRRILRRAVRFGRQLGFEEPFLYKVGETVVDEYGEHYPELEAMGDEARQLIKLEEERFFRNIDRGIELFEQAADAAEQNDEDSLSGEKVFELHATYGFPPDLTEIMAEERGLDIEWARYKELWKEHQETSRSKDTYADAAGVGDWTTVHEREGSNFVGYDALTAETFVTRFRKLEDGPYQLLLVDTPFYAEAGGQVGDQGMICSVDGSVVFKVVDTQKAPIGIVHFAELVQGQANEDTLSAKFEAAVDEDRRWATMCNHTATHLLHSALRDIVSDQIFQSGSLVAPDRLRFDFSHGEPLSEEELRDVEDRVNARIREAIEVAPHLDVERDYAVEELGAMAIFGEKYGDKVRVIQIADESTELCGGTHVPKTSDINLFRITSESSVAAGIRRVEAVTNEQAYQTFQSDRHELEDLADLLKSDKKGLLDRARAILDEKSELEKQVDKLSQKLAHTESSDLVDDAVDVGGVKVIASKLSVDTRDQMLKYADRLREQLDEGVVLLVSELDGKAALVCVVTDAAVERGLKAGPLINQAASHVDGRGGGRPTLAQAGGTDLSGLDAAVDNFVSIVEDALG
ncbi:MAG: alanine--tRNA ligase [Myxococcota bacterium]